MHDTSRLFLSPLYYEWLIFCLWSGRGLGTCPTHFTTWVHELEMGSIFFSYHGWSFWPLDRLQYLGGSNHFCFQLLPALFGHFKPFPANESSFQEFKYISIHVQIFPAMSCSFQLFVSHSSHYLFGMTSCGSVSLKLCTCKAALPWSQWHSPASHCQVYQAGKNLKKNFPLKYIYSLRLFKTYIDRPILS